MTPSRSSMAAIDPAGVRSFSQSAQTSYSMVAERTYIGFPSRNTGTETETDAFPAVGLVKTLLARLRPCLAATMKSDDAGGGSDVPSATRRLMMGRPSTLKTTTFEME